MITFAIGDIHGCYDKLLRILDACSGFAGKTATHDRYKLVFLGDYIDRGPNSRQVVQQLRRTTDVDVCLKGNHEDMLELACGRYHGDLSNWLDNGGGQTLASYGATGPLGIDADDRAWLASRPLSHDDGKRLFVHAGIDRNRPLDDQLPYDLMWMREPFLSTDFDVGRLIVHGHTPVRTGMPDLRKHRLNLDTRAFLGGPLTAAAFTDDQVGPFAYLQDNGKVFSVKADAA